MHCNTYYPRSLITWGFCAIVLSPNLIKSLVTIENWRAWDLRRAPLDLVVFRTWVDYPDGPKWFIEAWVHEAHDPSRSLNTITLRYNFSSCFAYPPVIPNFYRSLRLELSLPINQFIYRDKTRQQYTRFRYSARILILNHWDASAHRVKFSHFGAVI